MQDHDNSVSPKSSKKTKSHMPIKLDLPHPEIMKPKIIIFGVGGAGGNALNNMIRSNLEGVEFVAANTDSQALTNSLTPNRIQLGVKTTKGLGAGSFPDRGKLAAEENIEEISKYIEDCHMVFIAAGMGGGTGTGAAPVIAKLAREREILTVGVVTKPFHFEGKYRMETAEVGIEELKKYVDTLIVIPNQNLFRIANESTTFESAFKMADDVLYAGVRGVTDLITMPGLVNLDFADIRTIMTKMGKAMMGTGEATGENRAILACEAAIANPLLDDISIKGAKGVLVNMTGGPDMTLFEADMAVNAIRKEVDQNANIIFGSAFDENMKGRIRISVVATGIDSEEFRRDHQKKEVHEPSRFRAVVPEAINHNVNKSFFDPGVSAKPQKTEIDEISDENFKPKKTYVREENFDHHFEAKAKSHQEEKHNKSSLFNNISEENFDESEEQEDFSNEIEAPKILKNAEKSHEKHHHKNEIEAEDDNNHRKTAKHHHDSHEKPQKASKVSRASKRERPRKESGFSLFSFMNKEKAEPEISEDDHHHDERHIKNNIFSESHKIDIEHEHSKKHHEESSSHNVKNEADKKRQQFFGGTVFDEENEGNSEEKFDDEIINVPAFFRRKK